MIIFICGPHGCGKTTLINDIKLDKPMAKVINLDMSERVLLNNPGSSNQFLRHELYFQTMREIVKLPSEYIILVDRAPVSLTIYDRTLKEIGVYGDRELKELVRDYDKKRIKFFDDLHNGNHRMYTVRMDVPIDTVIDNISKRNRDKSLREGDRKYLELVQRYYENENSWDLVLTNKTNKEITKENKENKENYLNKRELYNQMLKEITEFINSKE